MKDDHDLEKFDSIDGTGSQGASEPRFQSDMILFAVRKLLDSIRNQREYNKNNQDSIYSLWHDTCTILAHIRTVKLCLRQKDKQNAMRHNHAWYRVK